MHIARQVRVTGRVQGVFFRAWTAEQARDLGVNGWVWNASEGSVEARLQGEEIAVNQLIERMREGPDGAEVTNVEIADAEPENMDHFTVRH